MGFGFDGVDRADVWLCRLLVATRSRRTTGSTSTTTRRPFTRPARWWPRSLVQQLFHLDALFGVEKRSESALHFLFQFSEFCGLRLVELQMMSHMGR